MLANEKEVRFSRANPTSLSQCIMESIGKQLVAVV
jgi:hypothetical protein